MMNLFPVVAARWIAWLPKWASLLLAIFALLSLSLARYAVRYLKIYSASSWHTS
jgi:hypothetical protein